MAEWNKFKRIAKAEVIKRIGQEAFDKKMATFQNPKELTFWANDYGWIEARKSWGRGCGYSAWTMKEGGYTVPYYD